MNLILDNGEATYRIQAYQPNIVIVNNHTYKCGLCVMPQQLITPWGPNVASDLSIQHIDDILVHKPNILLLGTGSHTILLKPYFYHYFANQSVKVEVMNSAAACRTYMLLMAQGEKVAAALLM